MNNKEILNIAAIQLDITWGNIEANLTAAKTFIDNLPADTDIAVLPEMFSTGFICDKTQAIALAETIEGITISTIRQWAQERDFAICGSFIAQEGECIFNRAFFILPSGDATFYDKHHLFSMSGEDSIYTRGSTPIPIINFRGWNIAMAICFELRFPAWCRNHADGYDVIIFVANWPESRAYAWEHLLIARAIENQAYVVGCNRTGTDDYGNYPGHTFIIDPKGQKIGTKTSPFIISASMSRPSLLRFRQKFPVYLEGDRFSIKS